MGGRTTKENREIKNKYNLPVNTQGGNINV